MRFVDAAALDRLLTFGPLIDALEAAFRGGVVAPTRHHHHIPRPEGDGTLLLMPAWTEAGGEPACLGTKLVTVFPGNAARGLPSIAGLYVLVDGATGAPLAVFDGARLTLWRTAAASALAARAMARADSATMLMVGAGALSRFLVQAHASVLPLSRILIWNRSPAGARQVADALQAAGLDATATEDLRAAVEAADLVSCATLSTAPLIRGEWLRPGQHLDLVGAFNMSMREVDDATLSRARVMVDTPAALSEGGDVAVAIRSGAFEASSVIGTLFDLAAGRLLPRAAASDITLFKSVGASLEDLAAAMLAWRLMAAHG
jgi:ornithine cyclodeaminase/alanine dehydrogenase-like protein (mu-crystallin family)